MVLPFVDEAKPKCYLCHDMFDNIENLRKHQKTEHEKFLEYHKNNQKRQAAPGDVTVF